MRLRAKTWTAFGACVVCGAMLLAWMTTVMLELERAEASARAHAAHEVALGGALWQMDGWLLPILAEEAQRPTSDYLAFNPVHDAYTNLLGKLSPGDVLTPSPLLSFRSEWFPLHFQVDADGEVTSPQVPLGNQLDVAQSQATPIAVDDKRELLHRIKELVSPSKLIARCSVGNDNLPEQQLRMEQTATDGAETVTNYSQRAQATTPARQKMAWAATASDNDTTVVNPSSAAALVPLWLDDPSRGAYLVFVRRVMAQGRPLFQGVLADWSKLSAALLAAIGDAGIAHGARLVRVDQPDPERVAHLLTVVPACLEATPPPVVMRRWTPGQK